MQEKAGKNSPSLQEMLALLTTKTTVQRTVREHPFSYWGLRGYYSFSFILLTNHLILLFLDPYRDHKRLPFQGTFTGYANKGHKACGRDYKPGSCPSDHAKIQALFVRE